MSSLTSAPKDKHFGYKRGKRMDLGIVQEPLATTITTSCTVIVIVSRFMTFLGNYKPLWT